MKFPQPVKLSGNASRWRLSDLLAWEAARNGAAAAPDLPASEERYLRDVEVAARYGVHRVTVWAWASQSSRGQAA